jgi:hypothetical protein
LNIIYSDWSQRFIEALARSARTVAFAVRISQARLLSEARYWFRSWSLLTAASELAAEQLKPYKAMYRHKMVRAAYLSLKEDQLRARVKLAAIVVGIFAGGSGWVWLSVSAYAAGGWYAATSAGLFLLNAVATAPAAAFTGNPWRRLGGLAVLWAALSVCLLAADNWPSLDSWHQQPPDPLQILGFASGSIALFCLLGTLLARIAFFVGDVLVDRRRTRRYPETSALLYTVAIVDWLRPDDSLGDLFNRRELMRWMNFLVDCLNIHIARILAVGDHGLPETAHSRFNQAASALRGYQTQIALPRPDTHQTLRARLAELAVPLLTGHYDLLPTSEATVKPPALLGRQPARLAVGLLVAALPLTIVAAYPLLGFSLPDYLRQWLAGFALVWLIAKILQSLDPGSSSTWDRVHAVLNSPRPPSDKP